MVNKPTRKRNIKSPARDPTLSDPSAPRRITFLRNPVKQSTKNTDFQKKLSMKRTVMKIMSLK